MCGIAGVLRSVAGSSEDIAALAQGMAERLHRRGPDAAGVWSDPDVGVALAHRRLAIIDVSDSGAQPMVSHCGRYVLTYNGELYNQDVIRRRLEVGAGVRGWRGRSDTEVLLEALAAWGVQATLPLLNGMFAFALWDRAERVLHLGRDRFGEKPLYYGWIGKAFVFASQPLALRVVPGWSGAINRHALRLFMRYGSVPTPHSIFEGIYKLPAAGHVTIDAGRLRERSSPKAGAYWSISDAVTAAIATRWEGSESDAVDALDRQLREAVRRRMQSDVPIGALLSGGIDSSLIVSLMQAQSGRPVRTFSIGFEEPAFDEAQHAALVAKALGTSHTEHVVTAAESLAVIPRLPLTYDEPFADASQIPTMLVCGLARRDVTVCLSGDGADELFGGYDRYRQLAHFWRLVAWLPASARTVAARAALCLPAQTPQTNHVMQRRGLSERFRNAAFLLGAEDFPAMYRRYVCHWRAGQDPVEGSGLPEDDGQIVWDLAGPHPAERMMAWDSGWYLRDDLLVKLDRASMAVSLEARVPFLDPDVFELAWRLPSNFKIRGSVGKWLLRQLLYRYVPSGLVDRPKQGFAVPIGRWLCGPLRNWAEAHLEADCLRRSGHLNVDIVRKAWSEHLQGLRNWQYPLWNVLMFQQWLEQQREVSKL